MTENQPDAVLREQTLYRYTSAVERGDFAAAAAILAQAEGDPQLEQMIVEINAALAAELPPAPRAPARPRAARWQRIQAALRALAPGVGLSALILLLVFGVLALTGPFTGNTFTNAARIPTAYYDPGARRVPASALTAIPLHADSGYSREYPAPAAGAAMSYPAPQALAALQPTATPYNPPGADNPSAAATAAGATAATNQPRLVVRNGYLVLTVADTRKARGTVSEVISGYAGEGAFILSSSEQGIQGADRSGPSDQPVIFMRLRVPVARYDAVMDRLVGLALTVDARQEQADDVTAEYVDTQARIRELETAIDRLLEIARSAKNTDDLLRVEKALSDRRAELEALKGRAQYLSQTAALSLIQLELRPTVSYPTPAPTLLPTPEAWRPRDTAQRSVLVLLRDLRRAGDGLIVFGITTLPWILVAGIGGFAGYRVWRRRRR